MKFRYKPITNTKQHSKATRALSTIKFIVIHDTGNPSKGADAEAHYRYLQTATRYGSAHYYVDDKEIIQTIGDSLTAWAVGDKWAWKNRTRTDVTNYNSLSAELCINKGIGKEKAYKNLVELTKNLMKKFNITDDKVVRHYDATGKLCPNSWSKDNWSKWWQFKEDIKKPIEWQIDLSKDSEFGKEEDKMTDFDKEYQEAINKKITDGTRPDDNITRKEAAVMILRAIGNKKEDPPT